jgi:hypothetical protein
MIYISEKIWLVVGSWIGCFPLFLRGVLGKVVCSAWFFAGEFVVSCVVNVDGRLHLFHSRQMRHNFSIIFCFLTFASATYRLDLR